MDNNKQVGVITYSFSSIIMTISYFLSKYFIQSIRCEKALGMLPSATMNYLNAIIKENKSHKIAIDRYYLPIVSFWAYNRVAINEFPISLPRFPFPVSPFPVSIYIKFSLR